MSASGQGGPPTFVAEAFPMTIATAKRSLRQLCRERRRTRRESNSSALAEKVCSRFFDEIGLRADVKVAAYWPRADEFDVRPLLRALHRRGHDCGLPVVMGPEQALKFRAWHPGASLQTAEFDIMVPEPEAAVVVPEVLLLPLLAFDIQGNRLGSGLGFYDRTLAALRRAGNRVVAIGVAFASQQVETVPHDENDERLDWVVTEKFTLRMRPPPSS